MADEDLKDLPGPVQAELTRLRAERVAFTEERKRLRNELREAELQARELTKHRDELIEATQLGDVTASNEQADVLTQDLANVRAERDTLRAELTEVRTERDRLRMRLLEAELQLSDKPDRLADVSEPQGGSPHAEQRAAELARELVATRQTISWRITAPLRAVRKRTRS